MLRAKTDKPEMNDPQSLREVFGERKEGCQTDIRQLKKDIFIFILYYIFILFIYIYIYPPTPPVEGGARQRRQPRACVGGERTASSRLLRRCRHSRRLEALLRVRKRKTGCARRCFTDLFYGFRKRR